MKAKIRHLSSKITAIALTICMACGSFLTFGLSVKAANVSSTSIGGYTLSAGRVTTYTSPNGSVSGYIDGTDYCTILSIQDNWVKVNYPISGNKTKVAYTPASAFFVNPAFTTETVYTGKSITVYRRSDMKQKLGTVYGTDGCVYVGNQNGKTQLIYPINGGFKVGFIDGTVSGTSSTPFSTTSPGQPVENGLYFVKSSINPEFVFDIENISMNDSANLSLHSFNGGANQVFEFIHQGDGLYIIKALHSGKVLDVIGKATSNGSNIAQHTVNYGDNQLFYIEKNGSYYSFRSKHSGKYVDVYGGKAFESANISIYEGNNGTPAQKFILSKAVSGSSSNDSTNVVAARLNSIATRCVEQEKIFTSAGWRGNYQCNGFAKRTFYELFNDVIGAYDATKYNIPSPNAKVVGVLSPSQMSYDAMKQLLINAQPGDFIQVKRRASGGPHSMIVMSVDANGITILDANSDGRNTIMKYYQSFTEFYNKNQAMTLLHAKNYK